MTKLLSLTSDQICNIIDTTTPIKLGKFKISKYVTQELVLSLSCNSTVLIWQQSANTGLNLHVVCPFPSLCIHTNYKAFRELILLQCLEAFTVLRQN